MGRDPHAGPVPDRAWEADRAARARGRVAIFNATRPDGPTRVLQIGAAAERGGDPQVK